MHSVGSRQDRHDSVREESFAFRPYLDTVAIGLGFLNADYELQYCNACFRDQLGGDRDLGGAALLPLLGLEARHSEAVMTAVAATSLWKHLIRLNDRALKVEIRSLPVDAAAPSSCRYSVAMIDYSNDLQHLHALAEAKNVAERTDKAKSQFLSHMSHELRTPLNAILGYTQLLKISPELTERQQDNLNEIEAAGNFLLTLINEILDLSSIESGKLRLSQEYVALGQVVEECRTLLAPMLATRNIQLDLRVNDDSVLLADHVRLKQILLNLLSNAIKYNDSDGRVRLQCFHTRGRKLRLEIQDSGPGICRTKLASIFSPFERLGAEGSTVQGTGIGLMITRRLVKAMQGDIGVFSMEGRGSLFWVEFPQSEPALLDSFLQRDAAYAEKSADSHYRIFWIGSKAPLFDTLAQLRAHRPALQLRHYDELPAADADVDAPDLILVTQNLVEAMRAGKLHKALKGRTVLVVKGAGVGHGDKGDAQVRDSFSIPADIKLTELLQLLDGSLRAA